MQTKPKVVDRGQLPPQAQDAEECVLAQMLLERNAVSEALSFLPAADVFFYERHTVVFEAIKRVFERGEPVDLITITAELRTAGTLELAGGAHGISLLSTKVNSAVNLEFHCRILMEKFIRRMLIHVSTINHHSAYDDTVDVFETLNKAQGQLIKLQEALQSKKAINGKDLFNKTLLKITEAKNTPSGITGVASGLTQVDVFTSGWQDSDLIIMAGRPGMGKTTAAMTFLRNAVVDAGVPCAFFSLEMSSVQLMTKLIAAETSISAAQLRRGNLEEDQWSTLHHKCGSTIFNQNLFIDDSTMTIQEIRSKSITMASKYGIRMIIIDYLQLIIGDTKGNREQEVGSISRALKRLAKELNMPVIALSQLSRNVENRIDKRPILSDLRESGSIEQDADVVVFVYRPEYYGITESESGDSLKNTCDLIFSKHRNGALGTITVGCDMKYSTMYDLNHSPDDFKPKTEYNPNQFTEPLKGEQEPWRSSDGI